MSGAPQNSNDPPSLRVWPVHGLDEVRAGDDLANLLADRLGGDLGDGEILVVSSKIVSKAEGRTVPGDNRADAIRAETTRVVATRAETVIGETRHGFVMAAAGVDASNVEAGQLALLPVDPDASARRLRHGLAERLGVRVGVVITDTFGRPWRVGQTDLAIGAAGIHVLRDFGGDVDRYGNQLEVTAPALADELAAAAELTKPKLAGVPVAVVQGLSALVTAEDGPGVAALVRPPDQDLFRLGTREAMRAALHRAPTAELTDAPADAEAVRRVLDLADPPSPSAPSTATSASIPPSARVVELDEPARTDVLESARLPPTTPAVLVFAIAIGAERDDALLALGATRERLTRACAVEELAACWVPASEIRLDLLRPTCETHEPIGLLTIGSCVHSRR